MFVNNEVAWFDDVWVPVWVWVVFVFLEVVYKFSLVFVCFCCGYVVFVFLLLERVLCLRFGLCWIINSLLLIIVWFWLIVV